MGTHAIESGAMARPDPDHPPRTRYWVLPNLQRRVIVWMVLVSALAASIAAWLVLLAVWAPMGEHLVLSSSGYSADALYRDASLRVLLTTGLLILGFGTVAFLVGLSVSHRIAGPLYRLGRVARNVADGHLEKRVDLRRGDYVHDFAADFNSMLDGVEQRLMRQEKALTKLDKKLCDIERASAEGRLEPDELSRELHDAMACVHSMHDDAWALPPAEVDDA